MVNWIWQQNLSVVPELDSTVSWTKMYTYENAIKRRILRNVYVAKYLPQNKPYVTLVFPWEQNVVVGGELGVTGQTAPITVMYLDSQKTFYQKNVTPVIRMEDVQKVYISLASLAGIDLTLPYTAYVNKSVISPPPTVSPTPTLTPIQPPGTKPGDLNSDGKVDIFDYNIIVSDFGKTGSSIIGDVDKNGKVDIFDYNVLIGNFGI